MRSIFKLRYGGGILLTTMGYTSLKVNASEHKRQPEPRHGKVRPQLGAWRRWKEESQSLAPFLKGLGAPSFATFFVDAILIRNDLLIKLTDDNILEVTDKTLLGSNVTKVELGAEEVERSTRTGRKKFMLSAFESEFDGTTFDRITVQCRLFQRGSGWYTQQSWIVDKDDILREQMVLKRGDDCDIVVSRAYKRLSGADHLNDGLSLVSAAQETKSIDYDRWTKTVLTLAGIGTVCLGTWFLASGKSSSASRDNK